ncbi:sodium-dependent nutrient amino acid transporter 1-like [Ornithodoros turicata]|uniref:sodium-dependent nutrient amino acid transporter 1-like n=1 Tax=Ornithodoros turicata TaxID=34597 RepID=UPI003139D057
MSDLRPKWDHKADYFFSCVGLSVGLGNLWRFPYLVYQNGGGAFLFVYLIILLIVGKPMYYLELFTGQFSNTGSISVWAAFPMSRGIGVAMCIGCFCMSLYINMYIAYSMIYMYHSLGARLPWSGCYDWWHADTRVCYIRKAGVTTCKAASNRLYQRFKNRNITFGVSVNSSEKTIFVPHRAYSQEMTGCVNATKSAAEHFFWDNVLETSRGISDLKPMKLDLTISSFIVWLQMYFLTARGMRCMGKVLLVTATCPYIMFLAMLMRGVSLDGASVGVSVIFIPNWRSIFTLDCWRTAIEQSVLSLGIATGCVMVLASHSDFYNDVFQDSCFIVILNFIWGLLTSTAFFSVMGGVASNLNVSISELYPEEMLSMAFVAYPEAIGTQAYPQMWTMIFFVAVFLMGLNMSMILIQTVMSGILEQFPDYREFRSEVTLLFCIVAFLIGLPLCTPAGPYFIKFLETYFGAPFFVIAALIEVLSYSWGYDSRRLLFDIEFMFTMAPSILYKILWSFLTPLLLFLALVVHVMHFEYTTLESYKFPMYSDLIGFLLVVVVFCQVPLWAISWVRDKEFKIDEAIQPAYTWGPEDPALFNAYQARLRNRGFVPMHSPFPVRFVVPEPSAKSKTMPVIFAAEPVRVPYAERRGSAAVEQGPTERVWTLPPDLPALDLSNLTIPLPKAGPRPVADYLPPPPQQQRPSIQTVPAILQRIPAPPRPQGPQVHSFLPTLFPNSLGPQFSQSPMRFGLLGRLFQRRPPGEPDDVVMANIPMGAPSSIVRLGPAYPQQPRDRAHSTSSEHSSSSKKK